MSVAVPLSLLRIGRNGLVKWSQLLLMGDDQLSVHLDSRNPECRSFHLSSSAS